MRKQRADPDRGKQHDPAPDPNTGIADRRHHVKQGGGFGRVLDCDAENDPHEHHGGNVVLAERLKQVVGHEQLDQGLGIARGTGQLRRKIDQRRLADQRHGGGGNPEAHKCRAPEQQVDRPALAKQGQRLGRRQASETEDQRRHQIGQDDDFHQPHVNRAERLEDLGCAGAVAADQKPQRTADDHEKGQQSRLHLRLLRPGGIHGVGGQTEHGSLHPSKNEAVNNIAVFDRSCRTEVRTGGPAGADGI
nr:hypothetical protein [Roseibium sp. RKSG952]